MLLHVELHATAFDFGDEVVFSVFKGKLGNGNDGVFLNIEGTAVRKADNYLGFQLGDDVVAFLDVFGFLELALIGIVALDDHFGATTEYENFAYGIVNST